MPRQSNEKEHSDRRVDQAGGRQEGGEGHAPAPTYEYLYREARRLGIRGRSRMSKRQLEAAVEDHTGRPEE